MPEALIQPDQTCIQILLIGGTSDEANQYAAKLREQGQAVEIDQIPSTKKLHSKLKQKTPYTFFLLNDLINSTELEQSIKILAKQVQLFCILLLSKEPEKHLDRLLQNDIRDIVHPANSLHLSFVILREQEVLQYRQILHSTTQQLDDITQRLKKLQENSRDVTAYRQEPDIGEATLSKKPQATKSLDAKMAQRIQQNHGQLFYQLILPQQAQSTHHYAVTWQLSENSDTTKTIQSLDEITEQRMTIQLDHGLITQATQALMDQHQQGYPAHFHLGLSGVSAQHPTAILSALHQAMQNHRKLSQYLTIQFDEQALRGELENAKKLIKGIHLLGCSVAMTQFENHQGSKKMLDYLNIDIVGFAPGWSKHIRQDDVKQSQLNNLNNQLQQTHDVQTMVSHVEDAESMALLWNMGFDYLLGDFIQPAQNAIIA